MTERLNNDFQFIEVGRKDPKKKLLRQRKKEFVEIYEPFKPAQAADQAGAQVGGDVTEEVRRDDDVELVRVHHQLHTGVINNHLNSLDIRITGGHFPRCFQE